MSEREILQRLVEKADWMLTDDEFGASVYELPVEARALLAQPEREPQWSDQPPTVPGWYWWKIGDLSAVCVYLLRHENAQWLISYPWPEEPTWHLELSGQWAGPITPPEE